MELITLTQDEMAKWDAFVETSPQGSLFAKSFYLDAAGADYRIHVAQKGDQIQGGVVKISPKFGISTNPRWTKYLGILLRPVESLPAKKASTEQRIVSFLLDNVDLGDFDHTFHPDFHHWLPFHWRGCRVEPRATYRFPALNDLKSIERGFDERVGRNARKAEKSGVVIRDTITVQDFYDVHKLTYERQGAKPPYPFEALERLTSALIARRNFFFMAAEDDKGLRYAVTGVAHDERCAFLLFNGVDLRQKDVGANSLLVRETIRRAAGVSRAFDFEGSMIPSIERFYRGFGGDLTTFPRIWRPSLKTSLRRQSLSVAKRLLGYKR